MDGATPDQRHQFEAMEKLYGLNREELRKNRWRDYSNLLHLILYIHMLEKYRDSPVDREELDGIFKDAIPADEYTRIRDLDAPRFHKGIYLYFTGQVRVMMQNDQPYAAMIRYMVKVKWGLDLV